jgi:hypothetical protein
MIVVVVARLAGIGIIKRNNPVQRRAKVPASDSCSGLVYGSELIALLFDDPNYARPRTVKYEMIQSASRFIVEGQP